MMTKGIAINEQRIRQEFSDLVLLDSVSFRERQMADILTGKLRQIGFRVKEDHIGAKIGGNAGNLYGFLKGTVPGEPILLSAHMDTVTPGIKKQAVFREDGTITSSGNTVLGADDVNGIVGILEGVRSVREAGLPHRAVEVLFSVAEEAYCKGAEQLNYSRIQSKEAYVLDMSGSPGSAALQAPTILSFRVTVTGKASHAGFSPQQGIHAIRIMSEAISRVAQGHIGDDTTMNIGKIQGGEATNIVPGSCICEGEVRSYDHEKALWQVTELERIFSETVQGTGAEVEVEMQVHVHAYQTDKKSPVVRRFTNVCRKLGLPGTLTKTFGGSDNNPFALHGIDGIVLSCGMNQVHSVQEYTSVEDLVLCAKLVAGLITSDQ
jgi:tripeptide aminopeptidase